jgi:hypothetical protein
MRPTLTFKTKIKQMYSPEGEKLYRYIEPPAFTRKHCDMHSFRTSRDYGGIANSTLFPGALKQLQARSGLTGVVNIDASLPDNVVIDDTKFLAVVTLTVPERHRR